MFEMSITGVKDVDLFILQRECLREDVPALQLVCKKWKMEFSHLTKFIYHKVSYSQYLALHGNMKTLKWAKKNCCPWDSLTFENAVKSGNLNLIKWLAKKNCPITSHYRIITYAIQNGKVENLKWLHDNLFGLGYKDYILMAARKGKLDIIKWLVDSGTKLTAVTFECAACGGNLEIIEWLHKNGCPWNSRTFSEAARTGNRKLMEWLLLNGCPWDAATFTYAALDDNIENMEWLLQNGCPYANDVYFQVAPGACRKTLQWLKNHGFNSEIRE